MSLVDAYARLKSGACDEVLFIHADQGLPDVYLPYQDEVQIPHALAMIIKLEPELEDKLGIGQAKISCTFTTHQDNFPRGHSDLPNALDFYTWISSHKKETSYYSEKYCWNLKKHVQ